MVQVIKSDEISTDFNFYYRYLERKYMKKAIKKFNSKCKKDMQEGESYVLTSVASPYFSAEGLRKKAIESGIAKAKVEIAKTYPITYLHSTMWGIHEVFDISQMLHEGDE